MDLLTNGIESIQAGIEDSENGTRPRLLSSVLNIHAGILLLYKEALRHHSPQNSKEVLVVAAGLYQVTPLKRVCLDRCRGLDECLAGGQAARALDAARQGLRYGVSCLGLLRRPDGPVVRRRSDEPGVGGRDRALVFAEKTLPWGSRIARVGAVGLIAGGTAALVAALIRG